MCLVEEEHQLRLVQVAHLGQLLKQLAQQVQQERGVHLGRIDYLVRCQYVDDTAPLAGLHKVVDVDGGLAKELVASLVLEAQQAALNGPDGGNADVAVGGDILCAVVAHLL